MKKQGFVNDLWFWVGFIFFVCSLMGLTIYIFPLFKEGLTFFVLSSTAFFLLYTCALMNQNNKLEIERREKINSFLLLKDWFSIDKEAQKKVFRACSGGYCKQKPGQDQIHCEEATLLYNHFEIIALSIKTGYANELVLKRSYRPVFLLWFKNCKKWLDAQPDWGNIPKEDSQKLIRDLHKAWKN
jgi:hypothetical protein